jgi:hypothetical protein
MSYRATLRDWWPLFGGVAVGLLGLAGAIGFGILLNWLIDRPDGKARALCDIQVEALLHSKDLVEVTRAGIIIDRLNCAMRRRL